MLVINAKVDYPEVKNVSTPTHEVRHGSEVCKFVWKLIESEPEGTKFVVTIERKVAS